MEFETSKLGTVEKDIFYSDQRDPFRSLDIYYPPQLADKNWPVMINIHGGAWTMGTKDWAWYSQRLADLGILGVSIEYRMSPAVKAPVHLQDSKCAIRFLKANAEKYHLDPDRIGIMGHSAGGHLASLVALTMNTGYANDLGPYQDQNDAVKCAIPLSGPSDIRMMYQFDPEFSLQIFRSDQPEQQIYVDYSPISWVTENAPPFLLVHGTQDEEVPYHSSIQLRDELLAKNTVAEMLSIQGGDHQFVANDVENIERIWEVFYPFVQKYL